MQPYHATYTVCTLRAGKVNQRPSFDRRLLTFDLSSVPDSQSLRIVVAGVRSCSWQTRLLLVRAGGKVSLFASCLFPPSALSVWNAIQLSRAGSKLANDCHNERYAWTNRREGWPLFVDFNSLPSAGALRPRVFTLPPPLIRLPSFFFFFYAILVAVDRETRRDVRTALPSFPKSNCARETLKRENCAFSPSRLFVPHRHGPLLPFLRVVCREGVMFASDTRAKPAKRDEVWTRSAKVCASTAAIRDTADEIKAKRIFGGITGNEYRRLSVNNTGRIPSAIQHSSIRTSRRSLAWKRQ